MQRTGLTVLFRFDWLPHHGSEDTSAAPLPRDPQPVKRRTKNEPLASPLSR